ncbi:hypothetical protein APHAL10511_000468 [Amanita phalloides]|nr:hypothetical protein APHAL10511_000468 [Amanita phalloides]
MTGLGYFAFQGGSPPVLVSTLGSTPPPPPQTETQPPPPPPPQTQTQPRPRQSRTRRARELERAEAERGEQEWVARGGVLRDAYGRVDDARTKRVRAEVDRNAWEECVRRRWDAYEERWRVLVERCRDPLGACAVGLGFGDVPWPVCVCGEDEEKKTLGLRMTMTMTMALDPAASGTRCSPPHRPVHHRCRQLVLADLTPERVEEFLLSPLRVRGCSVTPKARIRSSFLRWHPDKLGWLVDRVREGEVDEVKTAIALVVDCLQKMHGAVKA